MLGLGLDCGLLLCGLDDVNAHQAVNCGKCQLLHYTDTGYGHVVQHHQRTSSQKVVDVVQHVRSPCPCSGVLGPTPPTDERTTILQLVVQQIHHQRTKICHILTSGHVEMLGSGIAMWQICCTTCCELVRWWYCTTCP